MIIIKPNILKSEANVHSSVNNTISKDNSALDKKCTVETEVTIDEMSLPDEYPDVNDNKNPSVLEYSFEVGV